MSTPKKIRAITFDFWGTLFRDANLEQRHHARVVALSEIAGVDHTAADAALQVAYKEFFRTHVEEKRTLDHHDGARLTAAHLKATLSPIAAKELAHRYASAIIEHPAYPIDGALEAVRAAAARFPIGVISDSGISPGSALTVLLENHGFRPHFKVLTFSDEVGVSKPQAPMFEITAAALGVLPSEILHIGDLEPTDIAGIQAMGGTAALIAATNDKYYETTKAEHRFRTWIEFITLLDDIL
jgi:FMN phosphatase YigB (HAD superfamily)